MPGRRCGAQSTSLLPGTPLRRALLTSPFALSTHDTREEVRGMATLTVVAILLCLLLALKLVSKLPAPRVQRPGRR